MPSSPSAFEAAPTKLVRDRVTIATYLMAMLWGWFVMSIGPATSRITEQFDVSRGVGGLHGTGIAVGIIAAGFISPHLVRHFGRRALMLAGSITMAIGVIALISVPSIFVTIPAVTIVGVGGTVIMNVAQPALQVHHGAGGPSAVIEANAGSAIIGIFGPLAVGGAVALGWGWQPALAITLIFVVIAFMVMFPLPTRGALDGRTAKKKTTDKAPTETVTKTDTKKRPYAPALWFYIIAITTGVAVEFSTSFWASDLIAEQTGSSAGTSTATVSALFGGMAIARIIGGPISLRFSAAKLMILAFVVAFAGWLLLWTSQATVVAFIALVLTGVGFGLHYPLGAALVMRASEGRPDAGQAVAAITTGAAVGLAPYVLGALSDVFGIHKAFIVVPVLVIIGGCATYFGMLNENQRARSLSKQSV